VAQAPDAAIDPSENAVSIDAAMAMRATLVKDSAVVVALCFVPGGRQLVALNVRTFAIERRLTGGTTDCNGSTTEVRRSPNR